MQPLYAIVRLDDDCFRLATVCPAPLWQSVRVLAYVGPHWSCARSARESTDARVLPSLWSIGADGLARAASDVDPAGALRARWRRPVPAASSTAQPAPPRPQAKRFGAH